MKFYKVTIPYGSRLTKCFESDSLDEAIELAYDDIQLAQESWASNSSEMRPFLKFTKVEEIDQTDYEEFYDSFFNPSEDDL
jgi:hypothetical protein